MNLDVIPCRSKTITPLFFPITLFFFPLHHCNLSLNENGTGTTKHAIPLVLGQAPESKLRPANRNMTDIIFPVTSRPANKLIFLNVLDSILSTGLVFVVEYSGIKHRSIMANGMWISYGVGFMIIAGIGYLVRDWRILTLIVSLCGVPVFAAYR